MITHLIRIFVLFNQLKNSLRPFMDDHSLDELIVLLKEGNNQPEMFSWDKLPEALKEFVCQLAERPPAAPEESSRYIVVGNPPDPAKWLRKKEVWGMLGIVRSTLDEKMAAGELKAYHLKGTEWQKHPRVFFKRSDIEAYRDTYSHDKGKTR